MLTDLKIFGIVGNSARGVTFEFVNIKVDCEKCKILTFKPLLDSNQLGMYWCVVNITKMYHFDAPKLVVLVENVVVCKEFFLKKTDYQYVEGNIIHSDNLMRSQKHGMLGRAFDNKFKSADICSSCNGDFTIESECSCQDSGIMIGNSCFKSIVLENPI